MTKPFKVWRDVYQVGGADISHPLDCSVYLLDGGEISMLIDAGAGKSFEQLVSNIGKLGLDPKKLNSILVSHAHIDHIGSLHQFQKEYDVQIIAHELDAEVLEKGGEVAAEAYGVRYVPCRVDLKIRGSMQTLQVGKYKVEVIHIPGHTTGSIAAYLDIGGKRRLL